MSMLYVVSFALSWVLINVCGNLNKDWWKQIMIPERV